MFNQISTKANETIKLTEEYQKEQLNSRKYFILNQMEENMLYLKSLLQKKENKVHFQSKHELYKKLNVDPQLLEEALSRKEIKEHYKPKKIIKIANLFFEPFSIIITRLFPWFYNYLHKNILFSGLKILSISYLSLTLFLSFIIFLLTLTSAFFFNAYIIQIIYLAIIISLTSLISFSIFPLYKRIQRKNQINTELPFIITHLAAAANSGLKDIELFNTLLDTKFYPCIKFEARRIVNYINLLGYDFKEILKNIDTPSKKLKDFLEELANTTNQQQFLNQKSKLFIHNYKTKKTAISIYFHIFSELRQTTRAVIINKTNIFAILLAIIIIILTLTYQTQISTAFYPILIFAIIIAWTPLTINTYDIYKRNKELETEFFKFIRDLRKIQNLQKIKNTDYGILTLYVQKLANQYQIGIPLEKALETFAYDTKNILIESVIAIVIKNPKNIYQTLDQMTTSKILRNLLKSER